MYHHKPVNGDFLSCQLKARSSHHDLEPKQKKEAAELAISFGRTQSASPCKIVRRNSEAQHKCDVNAIMSPLYKIIYP